MSHILQDITKEEYQKRYDRLKTIQDKLFSNATAPLYNYRKENGFYPVMGEGNISAKIMFVGEAPGLNEAKKGRPFCGAAGKFLDVLLAHLELARKDVYITNIVKDRPPENRDPLPKEIEFYAKLLDKQIEIIKPLCIVTLGRYSMGYLLPKFNLSHELKPISQIHGKKFTSEQFGKTLEIVTLYHPAFALYNGGMRETLLKDSEALLQFLA
ncbi:uracil-DNA glycosylase [bacterium]|nr:uracil-DNA glycosylase [bacterium]